MLDNTIINKAKIYINNELVGLCSAHDMYHIERVYDNSIKIFEGEQDGDELVIGLGAVFHEMLDEKFFQGKKENQIKKINDFLNSIELTDTQKEKIIFIIENIGYGKSLSGKTINKFIEFQIVEEADRLDAIGAIAIARTFAYGGKIKRPIYEPNQKPIENMTCEQYYRAESHSINHFYEKLLKLKDKMKTKVGKQIATERHIFMEKYLEQFFAEWKGER
ncbi:phosphohydrolase [Candidatus Gracilibacteria bacterium]|nr:phosphohydrolase [Candidatus Gracilibacteria bacterium]